MLRNGALGLCIVLHSAFSRDNQYQDAGPGSADSTRGIAALTDDKEHKPRIYPRGERVYIKVSTVFVVSGVRNAQSPYVLVVLGHFLSNLDKAAHSCRYGSSVELTDRVKAWQSSLCVAFARLPALPKDVR